MQHFYTHAQNCILLGPLGLLSYVLGKLGFYGFLVFFVLGIRVNTCLLVSDDVKCQSNFQPLHWDSDLYCTRLSHC